MKSGPSAEISVLAFLQRGMNYYCSKCYAPYAKITPCGCGGVLAHMRTGALVTFEEGDSFRPLDNTVMVEHSFQCRECGNVFQVQSDSAISWRGRKLECPECHTREWAISIMFKGQVEAVGI